MWGDGGGLLVDRGRVQLLVEDELTHKLLGEILEAEACGGLKKGRIYRGIFRSVMFGDPTMHQ